MGLEIRKAPGGYTAQVTRASTGESAVVTLTPLRGDVLWKKLCDLGFEVVEVHGAFVAADPELFKIKSGEYAEPTEHTTVGNA